MATAIVGISRRSMQEFVFVYRVPLDYVPGSEATQLAWRAWFEGIGTGLLAVGKPVVQTKSLGSCADGVRLGGYSLIRAADLDAALGVAAACPALGDCGGVEVGALHALSDASQELFRDRP
jgi:hypothetical protein